VRSFPSELYSTEHKSQMTFSLESFNMGKGGGVRKGEI